MPPAWTSLPRWHYGLVFTTTVKCFCAAHLFVDYVYRWGSCVGPSMLPTFEVWGDEILASPYYRRGRGVKPGDLVEFTSVIHPGETVVKRVIGMPGDYVLRDTPGSGNSSMLQIPPGHFWAAGDNLDVSRDSRLLGPIPMGLIKGKVTHKMVSLFRWDPIDQGFEHIKQ